MIRSFLLWQREAWRAFWRQRAILIPAIIASLLVLADWVLMYWLPSTELVIMRYSIYVGPTWIAPVNSLIIVPLAGSICVLLNFFFAYTTGRSSVALKYLWVWSAVILAAGFLWLTWLLVRINS